MWAFQYKHGDRPLEGFTIQRAAGRGGFGEVYYALSDSGREVALKSVTTYEQIELRGISQCMNLKSPHLVSIFDVKYNAQGRPFVVMEFVSGPSLRQLIDESPSGLGEQKSAFFLREIAKGLTFLHDCGIVHRDLKPGNIFYENGYVKIGDYGLSKAITMSQHSGQTVTVGTVHYMAPEIGAGKYDRSIDIYAMGAVLFEMLTGVPPFVGASPSEVLLKHLSAEPDCSGISEPFAGAIRRAMAKDPQQRFQSVQEMVEAVFGAEHIQQSVSVFSPQELSMVAAHAAKHIAAAEPQAPVPPIPPPLPVDPWGRAAKRLEAAGERVARRAVDQLGAAGDRIARSASGVGGRFGRRWGEPQQDFSRDMTVPIDDPLTLRPRIVLAGMTTLVLAAAAFAMSGNRGAPELGFIIVALAIAGGTACVLLARHHLGKAEFLHLGHMRHLLMAAAAGFGVAAGPSIFWLADSRYARSFGPTLLTVTLASLAMKLFERLDPNRSARVKLPLVLAAGLIAMFAGKVFNVYTPELPITIAAGIMLAAQAVAPWRPRVSEAEAADRAARGSAAQANPAAPRWPQASPAGPAPATQPAPGSAPITMQRLPLRIVPPMVRYLWIGIFAVGLALGIAFFAGAGNTSNNNVPPLAGMGVGFCMLGIIGFVRYFTHKYFGIWSYLLRPLLMGAAVTTIFASSFVLGFMNVSTGDEIAAATFFIVFPSILLIVLAFIPGKRYRAVPAAVATPATAPALAVPPPIRPVEVGPEGVSPFKRLWAMILALLGFVPIGGLHRLYVGKIGTGILWLITGGLFYIGTIVDLILLFSGKFTDKQGRTLLIWEDASEMDSIITTSRPLPPRPAPTATAYGRVSSGGHAAGLLSALSGLLLFVGIILCIGLAMQIPLGVQLGAFGRSLAQDILRTFDGYSDWPILINRMAVLVTAIILLISAIVMIFARRRHGAMHQIRGLLAYPALLLATLALSNAFSATTAWNRIAVDIQANQPARALNDFMEYWSGGAVLLAGGIFLTSILLMAWPPQKGKPTASPAPAMRPQVAAPAPGEMQSASPVALEEKAGVA